MFTNAMTIPLLTCCFWTLAAGKTPFSDTEKCSPDIIDKIKSMSPTTEEIKEITSSLPWVVVYSNYAGFTTNSEPTFSENSVKVPNSGYVMTGATGEETLALKWDDLLSGVNPSHLKIHIWKYEKTPLLVLGYYLCKTEGHYGINKGGDKGENPHFGVAISHGVRLGAIPAEAYDTADNILDEAATLSGVREENFIKCFSESKPQPQDDDDDDNDN